MDEYLECRYQVLKRPSVNPQAFRQQKLKVDQTKYMATTLASWLMEKGESTDINPIEEKVAEGYKISMFPGKLFDQQSKKSTEPQKTSGRRQWKRIWTKGMVDNEGK